MTRLFCDTCGKDVTEGGAFHCPRTPHKDLDFCWPCFEEHIRGER